MIVTKQKVTVINPDQNKKLTKEKQQNKNSECEQGEEQHCSPGHSIAGHPVTLSSAELSTHTVTLT
jgi:hypothetical protein